MKWDILQPVERLPGYLTHFKDVVEAAERQQSRQQKQGGGVKKKWHTRNQILISYHFLKKSTASTQPSTAPPVGRLAISNRISIKHMFAFNTT